MIRCFALVATFVLVSGCATVQQMPATAHQPVTTSTERKIEATYKLGQSAEVYVGERMLRVQDFHVTTRHSDMASGQLFATEKFSLNVPPLGSILLTPLDIVSVTGTTERNGKTYRVVSLPTAPTRLLRFLVTADGAFEGSAINTFGAQMGWSYNPVPSTVRLATGAPSTQIDASKGFVNFELVYSGTTRESFQLLYREYTKDDLARPAFSQTLVYEKERASIRFRNLQIDVHEASNEKIRFTIISDGQR